MAGQGGGGASAAGDLGRTDLVELVEAVLRESGAPPCAVVDEARNVVYIHGRAGRFLEPPEGRFSGKISDMARPGLKRALAACLDQAARGRAEARRGEVRVESNGGSVVLDVVARPLGGSRRLRGLTLVRFEERRPVAEVEAPAAEGDTEAGAGQPTPARLGLQATMEDVETANEELQCANEELQSTNEELQSTNEELETSKEELQSLNEELATVNAELQGRIDELGRTNDDLVVRELEVETRQGQTYLLRVRPYRTSGNVIDGAVLTFEDRTVVARARRLMEHGPGDDAAQQGEPVAGGGGGEA